MNTTNDTSSRSQSSLPTPTHSSTALRPRGKRLISGLDEPENSQLGNSTFTQHSATLLESPFSSRAASPIPSKHPSRSSSTQPVQRKYSYNTSPARQPDQLGNDLAASFSGLWGKSWTSLQGLASNVLGSDTSELVKDKSIQRPKKYSDTSQARRQWGPQNDNQPGAGSTEERRAIVRERKRQELLMGQGYAISDASRMKRRTSDDFDSNSAPPGDHDDRDVMVYIHHIQKNDTLAGLSIKFNCQLATLKKANRLWSNDAIQTRKTVVVPVDACGVKGRPVPSPPPEEPAAGDGTNDTTPTPSQNNFPDIGRSDSSSTVRPLKTINELSVNTSLPTTNQSSPKSLASKTSAEEPPWKHDSWVHLDGHSSPIELARMPRTNLGFFPRARRKSVSYSDLDTPSASFDIPRPSITISETSSTSRGNIHQKRHSSVSSATWSQHLNGPGGVGKLGGRGPSAPGPSTGLDQKLSKHFPKLAAPAEGNAEDEYDEHSPYGGFVTFENVGGAIEGWMRKLAKNAAKAVEPPAQRPTVSRTQKDLGLGISGSQVTGDGDLIELSNAFEIGDDELDEEDKMDDPQRGRARLGKDTIQDSSGGYSERANSKRKGD
ncbi:MAG: hypothetical protein M1831_007127 [Alyxoria varia]|nr:MAG: hypothetical protein M1831_007127 [Alyxoria varia]